MADWRRAVACMYKYANVLVAVLAVFAWGAAVDECDHNQPLDDMRVYVLWVGRDAVDRNRQSAGRRPCEFGTRMERRPAGNWTRP